MHLLIYNEVKRFNSLGHTTVVVLHIDFLRLEHTRLDTGLWEELNQWIVLRQCLVATEELEETFFFLLLIARTNHLLGFGQILCSQLTLYSYQALYQGLVLFVELVITLGHRTWDNQRSTCIVDQYRVYLIDDSIVVTTLYQVLRTHGHIVAQVVKAKFIIRTERDVGLVGTAAALWVGLVLIDAVNRKAVEHIERTHPFWVTLSQVVIDRYDVYTITCQGIQEYGESTYEGFTFTRCHFGNLTLVQYDTTKQLYIVVYHVPLRIVTTSYPVVLIDSLIAFDGYKVVVRGQFTVKVVGCNLYGFVLSKAACCILYNGEYFGQCLVECFLHLVEHLRFEFVYLVEDYLTVFNRSFFYLCLQRFNLFLDVVGRVLNLFLPLLGLGT